MLSRLSQYYLTKGASYCGSNWASPYLNRKHASSQKGSLMGSDHRGLKILAAFTKIALLYWHESASPITCERSTSHTLNISEALIAIGGAYVFEIAHAS
jgi:hypothetical protein